jgi:hypothetical protein
LTCPSETASECFAFGGDGAPTAAWAQFTLMPITYSYVAGYPCNHTPTTFSDIYGEPRTVREWLSDFEWVIEDPTPSDLEDFDLFLGHDEFWSWSSGKVDTSRK